MVRRQNDQKRKFIKLFNKAIEKHPKNFVYFDTRDQDFEETKKLLIMEKREMEEDFDDEDIDDADVWERMSWDTQDDFDNFKGEVSAYDNKNGGVGYVAEMHYGFWNGTEDTYEVKRYLEEIMDIIFDQNSIMDWRVAFEDGDLCITAYHHDGTNWAIIRRIGEDKTSKRLLEKYYNEEDDISAEEEDELWGEIFNRGTSVLIEI